MKKLITLLLCFASFVCEAQPYQKSTGYGNEFNRILIDSTAHIPFISKARINLSNANKPALIVATEDTCIYLSKGFGLPYNIKVLDLRDTVYIKNMLTNQIVGWNFFNHNMTATEDRIHNFGDYNLDFVGLDTFEISGDEVRISTNNLVLFSDNNIQIQGDNVSIQGVFEINGVPYQVNTDFAHNDLTFNGARTHNANGNPLSINNINTLSFDYDEDVFFSNGQYSGGNDFVHIGRDDSVRIGFPDSSQSVTVNQYASRVDIWGNLYINGVLYSGGGGSNFANTDLTFSANRTHNLNDFRLILQKANRVTFNGTTVASGIYFTGESTHLVKLGDPNSGGNSTTITVDDPNKSIDLMAEDAITVQDPSGNQGISLDFSHRVFIFGDASLTGNGTSLQIEDNNSVVTVTSNESFGSQDVNGYLGMFLDYNAKQFTLGDASVSGNGTRIVVDDNSKIIQMIGTGQTINPEADSTATLEPITGIVKKYYQPYIYGKISGQTNGSTVTKLILTTANRTTYRIQVDYVGRNGSGKSIAGTKQAVYYGGGSVQTVCTPTDIQLEGVLNMNPLGYCNIVTSGGDVNVEFSTDATDGAIDWDIIVRVKVY